MPPLTWHWCCDCDVISPDTNAPLMSWLLPVTADQSALYFANLAPVLWQRCHVTCYKYRASSQFLRVETFQTMAGWLEHRWDRRGTNCIGGKHGSRGMSPCQAQAVWGRHRDPGPVWDVVSRYWEETTWPPAHPGTSTQLWPGHRGGNIGSEERGVQWQQRGLRTQWSQWRD